MENWIATQWNSIKRHRAITALALAVALSFGSYEFVKPAAANAASAARPAAAALDENSVNALLTLDRAMETLAAHVTPAVVNVTVAAKHKAKGMPGFNQDQDQGQDQDQMPGDMQRFFGPFGFGQQMRPGPQIEHGLGSGFIISPDGYIVTNNHVIDGATDIRVTMTDRRVLPAKLIGADPLTDLALIKVDARELPSVPWGNSGSLMPGQTVLAFGNPFNFRFTVTRGIVSALNRPNPSEDRHKLGEFIQTDAAINPGNSGGPLVNARGEVIGINTFLISSSGAFSGMGFAIPEKVARPVIENLLKYGKVEHSRVGVVINDVTPENAKFFHMDKASGALVSQVEPDSPGAKAGLKVGDIITQVNGKKVEDSGELQVLVSQQRPGTKVNLEVVRDGKNLSVPVTLESLNASNNEGAKAAGQEHGKARWGLGLMAVTPDMRDQLQLSGNVQGAVVANVQPGSPADNAGISRGDVIAEVNRHKVSNAAEVRRELGSVKEGQDALLLVYTRGGSSFIVMHSAEEGGNADSGE